MPAKFELIAPCFFGCEATAKFELTRIGAENIRVGDGRLTFAGGPEMIAAANLNLRTVERVMLLLNTYPASTFDELFADQAGLIRAQVALDAARDKLAHTEHRAHQKMLGAKDSVCSQYGDDSNEYAALGMKKKSERKKGGNKARPPEA